jgi:serine/threonine protein kinase
MDSDEEVSMSGSDEHIDKNKGLENFGDIINGKYVLIKKLGYGTFSVVWLAYLLDRSKPDYEQKFFAIKVFHPEDYELGMVEHDVITKFKNFGLPMVTFHEMLCFTPLNEKHQSVCLVFDVMTCSAKNLVCMNRYIDGIPENVALHVILEVTKSLLILQQNNYLYTDVRPENIMIKSNNDQLDQFCKNFYDLHHDEKWYEKCNNMLVEHGYNLNNKSHKEKYSKLKRKTSIKLIRSIIEEINSVVDEIPRNVQISDTMTTMLIDYNNACINEKKNTNHHVQSRNYKAPEVLLKLPYTYKIDVWSLGCTFYELLTGEMLFDPEGSSSYSTDCNHIYWMVEVLGQFPKHMTKASNTTEKFFYSNGKFKIPIEEENWSLEKSLEADKTTITDESLQLLKDMLRYDPHERISFIDIIDRIEKIINV